ncbi:MAG: FliI/YscN family ATPase [Pseudomonadales bacterium]
MAESDLPTMAGTTLDFPRLRRVLQSTDTLQAIGRVVQACGTVIKVTGLPVRVGELCSLYDPQSDWQLSAEVVGLAGDCALLTPLGSLQGISNATRVISAGRCQEVVVGVALLGRVIDGNGHALDSGGPPQCEHRIPLYADPPNPMQRAAIKQPLATGVRAIDSMLACGEGQRMGIFAAAGGGKSILLSMLARGSEADVNVIALIGERGREVQEFVRDNLQDSLHKTVLVVATSDRPALERARATYVATAIAEYFRDQGQRVQLLVDSVTRFARALRDVGLAAGEPPTRRGFPPSVFSVLPQLFERAGNNDLGSISAFYTVLMEDEDSADPIAEEVRSLLDGHIYLSRQLAAENHYPAIDVLASASRLMDKLVTDEHEAAAARARQLLAKHKDIELLVQLGEYKAGHDADGDAALACAPRLREHLTQSSRRLATFSESQASLYSAIS